VQVALRAHERSGQRDIVRCDRRRDGDGQSQPDGCGKEFIHKSHSTGIREAAASAQNPRICADCARVFADF
jgi:hypothetical protein